MPKEYFSIERTTSLSSLAPGAKIHVIGVCGVAMAQLATTLSEQGYEVSGSDKEFYEPMGSLLARSAVKCHRGFDASNIPKDAALAVVGNAVSYGNPEVAAIEAAGYPYSLFPKLLFESVIQGNHSIVVTGTHGKSTTTAMIAVTLDMIGRRPGYFVGAVAKNLSKSLHVGEGQVSVVEGDEYDSAFFAKVPKFAFYAPDTLIITSIEFDHADIYADLESINKEFTKLVHSRPKNSTVICCLDFPNLASLVEQWRKTAACRIVTYGVAPSSDFRIVEQREDAAGQTASVINRGGETRTVRISLPGLYNLKNAVAALIACEASGSPWKQAEDALAKFEGVRRRQEVRADARGITLVEDFAHHPTAVRETLLGIRSRYPSRHIVAVFEPRSNTSRRKVFQKDYIEAFIPAGEVVLCKVAAKSIDQGQELMDVGELAAEITRSGVRSIALSDPSEIEEHLKRSSKPGDVIVIMSNGSFGGLIEKVEKWIAQ
jgi:UDP-N-acetylmuramate: L-alanyl-gamma-D-glutamyl-meso-diaminopimelate ligase